MTQDTLQEIEQNIKDSKEIVDLHNALERLYKNSDFIRVVTDGYFTKEAVRLVHLKADPGMATAERQAAIVSQIDAIGTLSSYFRTIAHNAMVARKAIDAGEEMRTEILAGGEA